jgi:hypothetical protein
MGEFGIHLAKKKMQVELGHDVMSSDRSSEIIEQVAPQFIISLGDGE